MKLRLKNHSVLKNTVNLGHVHTNPDIFKTAYIFLHESAFPPYEISQSETEHLFKPAFQSKATCKWAQQLPTMLGVASQQCCVRLHGAKSLTGFKLCATTPNNMQEGVQTDATCNIQQCWELLVNNVASVCTQPKCTRIPVRVN